MMQYKGYIGRVELDDEAGIFHGEIINIRDVITFQGSSVEELFKAFHESVDDYLDFCRDRGEAPDKPFSGQFVTRISPELHRQLHIAASISGKSLNAWIADQLQIAVNVTSAAQPIVRNQDSKRKQPKKTGKKTKKSEPKRNAS